MANTTNSAKFKFLDYAMVNTGFFRGKVGRVLKVRQNTLPDNPTWEYLLLFDIEETKVHNPNKHEPWKTAMRGQEEWLEEDILTLVTEPKLPLIVILGVLGCIAFGVAAAATHGFKIKNNVLGLKSL